VHEGQRFELRRGRRDIGNELRFRISEMVKGETFERGDFGEGMEEGVAVPDNLGTFEKQFLQGKTRVDSESLEGDE
jgi:hypothetical protein